MISIVSSNSEPRYLEQLHDWFIAEWQEIDQFEGATDEFVVLAPLLVLDEQTLIGGLAFTSALKPASEEIGLWVNALLITPEHRGKGLASRLVQKAIFEAERINIKEIYVFTDVPTLYQKLGWQIVENSKGNTVLKIYVSQEPASD